MPFTFDVSTDRGKTRLLIGDTDTATVANQIFDDASIDAFLSLQGQAVYRAAATALLAIAASEVYIQKRIRALDLSTDGPSEAAALRALAEDYKELDAEEDGDELAFEIAENVYDDFSARERVLKQAQRGAL